MNRYAFLALCATLVVPAAPAVAAPEAAALTEGVIRKLDPASGTITIKHGEIANLNMGAMTMSFKARDKKMLESVKPGSKIEFDFTKQGKDHVITSIK